jgi:hypothetical protein
LAVPVLAIGKSYRICKNHAPFESAIYFQKLLYKPKTRRDTFEKPKLARLDRIRTHHASGGGRATTLGDKACQDARTNRSAARYWAASPAAF